MMRANCVFLDVWMPIDQVKRFDVSIELYSLDYKYKTGVLCGDVATGDKKGQVE